MEMHAKPRSTRDLKEAVVSRTCTLLVLCTVACGGGALAWPGCRDRPAGTGGDAKPKPQPFSGGGALPSATVPATSGGEILRIESEAMGAFWCVAVSPDGRFVAAGSGGEQYDRRGNRTCVDCVAWLWDVRTRKEVRRFQGHTGIVTDVAFSPDGRHLLTGSYDRTARLWEVGTGRQVRLLGPHPTKVHCVAFSPDGAFLAVGTGMMTVEEGRDVMSDCMVRLYSTATGKLAKELAGSRGNVSAIAFSPSGERLLSAHFSGTVRLWNVSTGGEVWSANTTERWITDAAFTPDGERVLSVSADHTARLWDAPTGSQLKQLVGEKEFSSVAVLPDDRRALCGNNDGSVYLWDLRTGQLEGQLIGGHPWWVSDVASSPDGAWAVSSGRRGRIIFWGLPRTDR